MSWNAGAQQIFGYDARDMIGQPIIQIIPSELHDEERQILANSAGQPPIRARLRHTLTIQTVKGRGGEASIPYGTDGVSCTLPLLGEHLGGGSGSPTSGSASATVALPPHASALSGICILLVEDEPLLAMDMEANARRAAMSSVPPGRSRKRGRWQQAQCSTRRPVMPWAISRLR